MEKVLTVLDSIKLTTEYFQNKGIESPRVNAELLLAHILNCRRLDLYLMFDRPLKQEEVELYRSHIARRSKNEPLQYIIGYVEFYGLKFSVNNSVLIPRQETEILVETVIESTDKNKTLDILDIGTGSGNIAVALAKYLPNASIVSVDCSSEAVETAVNNAETNDVAGRISFKVMDILSGSGLEEKKYDIIVSNPPYISSEQFSALQPELRLYEPRVALTDDADGYTFYRVISGRARKLLKERGAMFLEIGEGQFNNVAEILKEDGFTGVKVTKDYLNIDRVITASL